MSVQRDVIGIPGVEKLSPDDLRAIVNTADSLGIDPDWLLAVEKFESGLNPKAVNQYSGATGAIQFMPSTAKNLGTTVEALKLMSLAEQQKYVFAYLNGFKGRMKSLEDTYLAVFFPKAIGQSDDYVVGIKEGGTDFQKAVYKQNAGFDKSGSGQITRGNIVSTIRSVYNSGKGRPRVPVPGALAAPGGGFRVGLYLALFGVAAYGIYQWGISK